MSKIPKTWRLGELTSTTSHNNNKWGGIIIIIGGEMCDVTGELAITVIYFTVDILSDKCIEADL